MVDLGDVPSDALEDVAYLSRSPNRVELLYELTRGSFAASELRDRTGIPKTTLNRTLTEFEQRDWIRRDTNGEYVATPRGEHVAVQFAPLVRSMATIQTLGDDVGIIPPSELHFAETEEVFSLQAFDDMTVYRSTSVQPDKLYDVWIDRVRESDTLRILAAAGNTQASNAVIHDEVVSRRLETTAVCSPTVVELFLDPDRGYSTPADIRERHEAGGRLHRYEGEIPLNLSICDETVFVSDPAIETAIETRNDTVRRWALEVFERYLDDAELVTPDEIAG